MAQSTIELASAVRRDALKMVHHAKASHVGSALSIADIVAVLYGEVMSVDPSNPRREDRDRFLLSKGHATVAVYAALAERGFFPTEDLLAYGDDFSPLMNHVSHKVPGVEFSTGSLGHGLPFGAGKALAGKKRGQNWRTFVLMSDGEWDEGSNWEAALFASHHQLDHLTAVVDFNNLQSLDTVSGTLGLEPFGAKLEAFGWSVHEVDGHDHAALSRELGSTPWEEGKPNVLVAHTTKGKGVSFMEDQVLWHYRNPNDEQLAIALAELGEA